MKSRSYDYIAAKNGGIEERNKFLMGFITENLKISVNNKKIGEVFDAVYKTFLGTNSYHNFYISSKQVLQRKANTEKDQESLYGHGDVDLKKTFTKNKGLRELSAIGCNKDIEI